MDVEQIVTYWLTEAAEALRVADHLVEQADYSYALFFGHLAVEKTLKALFVARQAQHAPPIHNLLRLARSAGLDVDDETTRWFLLISRGTCLQRNWP